MIATTNKTLGRIYRERIKRDLNDSIKGYPGFFIARYKGLKAPEISQLRRDLSRIGANITVVRNKLTRTLLEDLKLEDISKFIEGPTAFIFSTGDPIAVSKLLLNFLKEHEKLDVAFAYIDKRILKKEEIRELSLLPTKEILIARVIGGIKAPLSGLSNVLSGALRKLVLVFDAIAKNKKEDAAVVKEEARREPPEVSKQEAEKDIPEQGSVSGNNKDEVKPEEKTEN